MGKCTYQDEHGKTCTKCDEYQSWDQFFVRNKETGRRASWCRSCINRNSQRYRDDLKAAQPEDGNARLLKLGLRRCSRCNEIKPLREFRTYSKKGKPKRPKGHCRTCYSKARLARTNRQRGLPEETRFITRNLPIGSTTHSRGGYLQIKLPGHHRANKSGWVGAHIVAAEDKYGIRIEQGFTVHHKNGVRDDNRPSNLELRVGQHGCNADAVDRLLVSDELRERAVELLRFTYGWTMVPPSKAKSRPVDPDQGDLFGAA